MKNLKTRQLIFITVLVISFFFCFWQTITGLLSTWTENEDYSYALLMPVVSGYLIWERRKEIKAAPVGTNYSGGVLLFLFLVVAAYGILGSSPSAVRPAMPFIILSATLFCFGNDLFKLLLFPLAMLFFMIPLPTSVQTWTGVPLKLISTKLGALVLQAAGVPSVVEGNIIDLGVTQLQVVDACSGLRYILPLFALGFIYAHFFEKTRWKQALLVLSAIPISIITNGARIGITGILAQAYGPGAADGFFHAFSGWLIFLVAFVMLFIFHYILKLIPWNNDFDFLKGSGVLRNASSLKSNAVPVLVSAALLVVVGLLSVSTANIPGLALKNGFGEFPLSFGKWKGQTENINAEMVRLSGAEEALNAVYTGEDKSFISLYIGFRGSPYLESENFFHSPDVCLPSSGWKVLQADNHIIGGVPGFDNLPVRKLLIERRGKKQLVYFWFQTKDRASNNVNINRFHLSLHALKRDQTSDLFIRPITPLLAGDSPEDAEKRMDAFARAMMRELLEYLDRHQIPK